MVSTKKILIIEDERPMARALELKLTHAGFDVKTVFNGEDGLLLLEKETYALVICDLVMPKIDGFKLLKILQEKGNKTAVIVLTNLSQEEDEKRAKALGARDFLIKSNTPIATIVDKVIEFFK